MFLFVLILVALLMYAAYRIGLRFVCDCSTTANVTYSIHMLPRGMVTITYTVNGQSFTKHMVISSSLIRRYRVGSSMPIHYYSKNPIEVIPADKPSALEVTLACMIVFLYIVLLMAAIASL